MASYRAKLAGREELAEGPLAFRLEKPAAFRFKAGQAIVLELLQPPPQDGQKRRTFSLVSAPFENTLAIATRMRDSAFNRALRALPEGAFYYVVGPPAMALAMQETLRGAGGVSDDDIRSEEFYGC